MHNIKCKNENERMSLSAHVVVINVSAPWSLRKNTIKIIILKKKYFILKTFMLTAFLLMKYR